MISVICVYNDTSTLDTMLAESLRRQDTPCELVCIDNTHGQHSCAAEVLNAAGSGAAHDIVMFVHQDVELLSPAWLSDAERMFRTLGGGAAAGVAGVDETGAMWASVWHGEPRQLAGGREPTIPRAVQTLDGCLLLVWRDDFRSTRFDVNACRGWYLYVADYCLTRQQCGYRSFVLPLPVYHRSTGPTQISALKSTVDRLVAKHRRHAPRMFTTVGELTASPAARAWWVRAVRYFLTTFVPSK